MVQRRISLDGFIDPERLYRWPAGVQRATGLGRKVYLLRSAGGCRLLVVGRSKYARGSEVIAAIEALSRGANNATGENGETVYEGPQVEVAAELSAESAAWSIA